MLSVVSLDISEHHWHFVPQEEQHVLMLVEKIVNRVGEQGFPLRREDLGEFDQTTDF
jgi:hypothetical protein